MVCHVEGTTINLTPCGQFSKRAADGNSTLVKSIKTSSAIFLYIHDFLPQRLWYILYLAITTGFWELNYM